MSVNIKRNGILQKLADQTLIFDANVSEVRSGTINIPAINAGIGTNISVTFSTPFSDADYVVIVDVPDITSFKTWIVSAKTTTGFTLGVGRPYSSGSEACTANYYAFKLIELEGYTALQNKVNNAVDSSPTQNSTNFVTSGGVYEAIANSASSFIGTQEEWENLSAAQKSQYEIVYITDDEAAVEKDIYSTTETKTNKVWIDGKPIYRKVINIGALPNTSSKDVNHNISNLDKIINYYGSAQTSGGSYLCLPYASTSSGTTVQLWANSTIVRVITGTDRTDYSGYIILEYTKTTD